ncbi:2'-5' RNA ligase family protein [Janthinobacterium sp. MDB2-8]|uniref:2'-5' RNA ligase family protein n=1 Tax=Janthinobacterium sp. MDB2-8 TaxID=1259338 RepID=UPI003F228970
MSPDTHAPRLFYALWPDAATRAACMHGLAEQGLAPRFEHDRFTPHVTLARQAPPPAIGDFAPIAWQASELVLVESLKSSGDYRILASRKLT